MKLSWPINCIATLTVIIFMTFLGMRLPFLEHNSKPKPRPRAVIKLSVKTASPLNKIELQHDEHNQTAFITVANLPQLGQRGGLNFSAPLPYATSTLYPTLSGRSPPLS